MNLELLVCIKAYREEFYQKIFRGEEDVLALIEKGSFIFDEGSGPQTVEPLEAAFFKKGKTYQRHVTEPVTMYLFRYKSEIEIFDNSKITFTDKNRILSNIQMLHKLDQTMNNNDFFFRQTVFADIVMQYCLESQSTIDTIEDELVRNSLIYINNNLHFKINLEQLASEYHFSYIQFSRRFKAALGITPQDYLIGARMKKARHLLQNSDLSIKKIALECGFSNEYYFSNYFKKVHSISPSAYRIRAKQAI